MKILWTIAIALLLATGSAVASEPDASVTFDVDKMTCATCPIAVRKAMERVDGVKTVEVSYDSKSASVTFDAAVTNAEKIGQASTDVGFPATVKKAND